MSERKPRLYLEDIVASVSKIEEYTKKLSFTSFKENSLVIDAVVRNLEIIGEAANNMPEDFMEKHSQIPWREMISMRNKVIHAYFGVDLEILWKTIKEDLPLLKEQIVKLTSKD